MFHDWYKCWIFVDLCEAYAFLMENIYVQFEGMVYQQTAGIPTGTNCALFIVDLFLYCYERDFKSYIRNSKRYDLIDMSNDTFWYPGDISTKDNPEFEKHIPEINNEQKKKKESIHSLHITITHCHLYELKKKPTNAS